MQVSHLRCARFVIDWHNYTWSMLADRWSLSEKELELDRVEVRAQHLTIAN